jgi:hypothetical protein
MKIITLAAIPPEPIREHRSCGRLAVAGYAHDHEHHR